MIKKNETTAYENKIKELHAELEVAARGVGQKIGEKDELISNNARLATEGAVLAQKITSRVDQIKKLDDEMAAKVAAFAKEDRIHSDRVIECANKMAASEGEYSRLIAIIGEAQASAAKLPDAKKELMVITAEVNKATKELDAKKKESETIVRETIAKLAETKKKEDEVKSLLTRVGIVTTQNEKDRHTLVIYVKRLQRYYNDHKIKLNILPKFKIDDIN